MTHRRASLSVLFQRISHALTPPAMRDCDEEQRKRLDTMLIFTFSGLAIFAAFAAMVFRQGNLPAARTHLGVVATYLVGLMVLRGGYPTFAMYFNIAATTVGIFGAMWFGGGLGAPAVVFVGTLPVVASLSLGKRAGIAGAVAGLIVVAAIVGLELLGVEPRQDPPRVLYVKRVIETTVIVLEMYLLSEAFQNLTVRAYGLLSIKRDELATLLDSMRQGVLAFDADGIVVGAHSQQAAAIFGMKKLSGLPVVSLLYENAPDFDLERELFATWQRNVFTVGRAGWDDLAGLAPATCVLRRGQPGEQHLRLEMRPVFGRDELSRVMLLVTDETEHVLLQRAVEEGKEEHRRSQEKMRRLAAAGAHTFVAYLASSRERITELRQAVALRPASLRRGQVENLFRQAHTVRGEARAFDLDGVERPMERLEALFRALLERRPGANEVELEAAECDELNTSVGEAFRAIDEAEGALVQASPIGEAILDQVTVSRKQLEELSATVEALRSHARDTRDSSRLERVVSELTSRPFGELSGQYGEAVQRWAEQCGKSVRLEISGKSTPIPRSLALVLPRTLGHLLRNAVAHGVETPQAREELGKSPTGLIRLVGSEHDGEVSITVEDDGSGLHVDELRARAHALGLKGMAPEELTFVDGLSTSREIDSLSGNGVGLGATRDALGRIGYHITVTDAPGRGVRFTLSRAPASPVLQASGA